MNQPVRVAAARLLLAALCLSAATSSAFGQDTDAERAAPSLVLLSPADGRTYASSLIVEFFSDAASNVCSLDDQPAFACSSGLTLTGLAHGAHKFQVTATSDKDKTSSVSSNFLVDTVPPLLTDVSPSGLNGTTVIFFFSSSDKEADGTLFQCSLDGQQFTPCSPGVPVTFSSLFDGPHIAVVSATDAVGNSSSFTAAFVVDGVGPVFDPQFDVFPSAAACPRSTPDTRIRFRAEDARGSDPVRYACALNSSVIAPNSPDFTPCNPANPEEPTFGWRCLPDALKHQLAVIAFDRFNNPSDPHILEFPVEHSASCPVNACAGPDRTTSELGTVVLDGSLSTASSFSWTQIAGPSAGFDPGALNPSVATPPVPGRTGTQILTFQLTATGNGGTDTDTVDIAVKNSNLAPFADAGGDQVVREGSPVSLSGALSYDPDADALTAYEWVQTLGAPVQLGNAGSSSPTFTAPVLQGGLGGPEVLAFQLRVFDDALFSAPDEVRVTVEQFNHAPAVDAGADQTKLETTLVTLAGKAADPDADPLLYSWTQVEGAPLVLQNADTLTASFSAPTVPDGGATFVFRLTATDGALAGMDDVVVHVRKPSDPPLCHLARASTPSLWPPSHRLVSVGIAGITDPDSPSFAITINGVMQDEPVSGTGGGDTAPDAVIQGDTALLRAERDVGGNGRIYRLSFTADDGLGGSCTGTVDVAVPPNPRATSVVNDGLIYDSTGP